MLNQLYLVMFQNRRNPYDSKALKLSFRAFIGQPRYQFKSNLLGLEAILGVKGGAKNGTPTCYNRIAQSRIISKEAPNMILPVLKPKQ